MSNKNDSRHNARILALFSLFGQTFDFDSKDDTLDISSLDFPELEVTANEFLSEDKRKASRENFDKELFEDILAGVRANQAQIDAMITECAPEWPLDKIAKVDLVILRIATFELLYGQKTPEKVAVDEAVELAKEFGSDTTFKFVNGVLGSVIEKKSSRSDLKPEALENQG